MLIDYLKGRPIEFNAAELVVHTHVCEVCGIATHGTGSHIATHIVGPAGEFNESFRTVPDALGYLLHFAAGLVGNGQAHGWEFAHFLTTWVMVATDGKQRVPQQTPQRMH